MILPGKDNKIDDAVEVLYSRGLITMRDINKIRKRYYKQLDKKVN